MWQIYEIEDGSSLETNILPLVLLFFCDAESG